LKAIVNSNWSSYPAEFLGDRKASFVHPRFIEIAPKVYYAQVFIRVGKHILTMFVSAIPVPMELVIVVMADKPIHITIPMSRELICGRFGII